MDSLHHSDRPPAVREGRRLVLLGAAGAAVLLATYALMVLSPVGQALGDEAYLGRLVEDPHRRAEIGRLLSLIGRGTLVAMALVLVAVGGLRRRWDVGAVAAGGFAVAVVTAEVLKRALPPGELTPLESRLKFDGANSYPSGHATIATSFVLALVLVSAVRWRPWVALIGAGWVSVVSTGTLAAGWHRPPDAIGGVALATACLGLAAGVLVARRYVVAPAPVTSRLLLPGGLLLVLLAAAGVGVAVLGRSQGGPAASIPPLAFPVASALISATAVGAVCGFTWLMRDVVHPVHERHALTTQAAALR